MGPESLTAQYSASSMVPDWVSRPLGEIASFRTGPFGSALHKEDYIVDGVPLINPMHIINGRLAPTSSMTVPESKASQLSEFRLEIDDIVIGRRGEMGRCAVVPPSAAGWLCGTGSMIVRCRQGAHPAFVQRLLASPPIVAAIEDASVGSTMVNLNQSTLANLVVELPPTQEQEAIAEALSDADALIESLEQLIAKKRLIKQGVMQELLTGKRRLPGFSGERSQLGLGEMGTAYGGLTGKTKADFGTGAGRYVPFMNVVSNTVVDPSALATVHIAGNEKQNQVYQGDLLFNGSSETPEDVALCALVADTLEHLYLNSFCFGYRLRQDAPASGLFLAYFFRSGVGRSLVTSLAQGSTRYNISKRKLLAAQLELPPKEEQEAIAAVLSDLDAELDALEQWVAKARLVKQGMMQELLTGRIRLV